MDASNNTTAAATNCTKPTTEKEIVVLELYSIFAAVSIFFYLAAIVVIVRARVYRIFLHRLTLYLSIGGILRSISFMLQVLPVDVSVPENKPVSLRKGWEGACVFGGFMVQYAGFLQAFTVAWICCYVFGLVVLQAQWKQLKHEIAGVAVIILAPFLFTWEPFITDSYGLLGTRCWIVDRDCHSHYDLVFIYQMAINVVPYFLLQVLGLSLMAVAILSLARKAIQKVLQSQHWSAVRDILPLTIYPLLYMLVVSARLLALVTGTYTHDASHAFFALIQSCSVALPLSLLLRSAVRRRLCVPKIEEKIPLTTTLDEENGRSESFAI